MARLTFLAIPASALVTLVLVGLATGTPRGVAGTLIEAIVGRVPTGDGLDAHISGQRKAIRYLGAEAPFPPQPCGPEALARNRELAERRVLLEEDPRYRADANAALLFYTYTPNGQSIDATLIREGLARAVRTDAAHGGALAALEAEAKGAGRGCLWVGMGGRGPAPFAARLTGFQETPSISTRGRGHFEAWIEHDRIDFKLSYESLEASVAAAHIHLGQRHTTGGVGAFLCGGGGKPSCPPSGTVTGTITAADVLGPTNQGIAPGELHELVRAMRAGATYANVHSNQFPGGEIRGQIVRTEAPLDRDDAE